MELLEYIFLHFIIEPVLYIYELFSYFNNVFPIIYILTGLFIVYTAYRFIVVRFIGGADVSPASVLGNAASSSLASDRAKKQQQAKDKRIHSQWANSHHNKSKEEGT